MDSLKKNLAPSKNLSIKVIETLNKKTIETAINAAMENNIDLFLSTNFSKTDKLPAVFKKYTKFFKGIIYQDGYNFNIKFLSALKYVANLNYDNMAVIGNDTPDLTKNEIFRSLNLLSDGKAFIGPSKDGGFYLFSITKNDFNKIAEEDFVGLPFRTGRIRSSLIKLLTQNGILSVKLQEKYDVDYLNTIGNFEQFKNIILRLLESFLLNRFKKIKCLCSDSIIVFTSLKKFKISFHKAPPVVSCF